MSSLFSPKMLSQLPRDGLKNVLYYAAEFLTSLLVYINYQPTSLRYLNVRKKSISCLAIQETDKKVATHKKLISYK